MIGRDYVEDEKGSVQLPGDIRETSCSLYAGEKSADKKSIKTKVYYIDRKLRLRRIPSIDDSPSLPSMRVLSGDIRVI